MSSDSHNPLPVSDYALADCACGHPPGLHGNEGCVACECPSTCFARVRELEAEVKRLREALTPFVDEAALGSYEWGKFVPADDDDECEVWVTVAQMRAAREALEAGER